MNWDQIKGVVKQKYPFVLDADAFRRGGVAKTGTR
jgi:hypothetical protein